MGIAARPLSRATSIAVGIALVLGMAAPPVLAIEPAATTVDMAWQGTPEGGVPFLATVTLSQVDPPGPATGATGDVTVAEGATTLGSCTLASGTCDVALTLATVADHTLTVSYPGDGAFAPASVDKVVTVIANTIQATGVGLNYGTFYPYKDSYRDTVTARGTRNESASVTIKVYSPTGKLLKTAPAIANAEGAYAWAWNGRNASGTMYPAGKYRVTQTLNDGYMTKTWTSYVNLSAKRLYTYTKTLTKTYAQRSYQSTYGVIWLFTLPSATLYKKLVFKTYAKSSPAGVFGPQDYTICRGIDGNCVAPVAKIGSSYAWRALTGSVIRNRSGRSVRLYAVASNRSNLKYGRVVVTYSVLK
jgi:hypothetical protein